MKRQGLRVSVKELKDLIIELDKERLEMKKITGKVLPINKKFQINIINKQPKCSDTWEIEK